MGHLSYDDAKKAVFRGLWLLAVVTLVEVFFSLLGKGHVIHGVKEIGWIAYPIGLILVGLSLYKAYFIIYEFMHMRYEAKSLAMTVLLPTILLLWAIIAFFQEGDSWKGRREQIKDKDKESAEPAAPAQQQGFLPADVYVREWKG